MSSHLAIHPTAIIDPTAELGEGVQIGPYAVVGPQSRIGDGTILMPHAVIEGYTTIGRNCEISPGAVIGGKPQDHGFGGETSYVRIGDEVIVRECVTINRGTGEGTETVVGDGSMLMAYSHLAHNCNLGAHVVLANNVQLAGYVQVGDYAFIGGTCVVHQFVQIGRLSIIGGFSGTRQDVPPFAMAEGRPHVTVKGINSVGLKRRGFDLGARSRLKKAYYYLWFSKLNMQQAIEAIHRDIEHDPNVEELIAFTLNSKRGIRRPNEGDEYSEQNNAVDEGALEAV